MIERNMSDHNGYSRNQTPNCRQEMERRNGLESEFRGKYEK